MNMLFVIDADTQLKHDAVNSINEILSLSKSIGAVGRQRKVWECKKYTTRWQSIEYITAQISIVVLLI